MTSEKLDDEVILQLLSLSRSNDKMNLVIKMMMELGLRSSELLEISIDDIQFDRNTILVYEQNNDSYVKNWKVQTRFAVSPLLMKDIEEFVIRNQIKSKLINYTRSSIIGHIKSYGKEIGIDITPEMLRSHSARKPQIVNAKLSSRKKIVMKKKTVKPVLSDKYDHIYNPIIATNYKALEKSPVRYMADINFIMKNFDKKDKSSSWDQVYEIIPFLNEYKKDGYNALKKIYPHTPNKLKAWNDIKKLMVTNPSDYYSNIDLIISVLPMLPKDANKDNVWGQVFSFVIENGISKSDVNSNSYYWYNILESTYPYIPDKPNAYSDIILLMKSNSLYVQRNTAKLIGRILVHSIDKQAVWNDFYGYLKSLFINLKWSYDESYVTEFYPIISSVYKELPDKSKAWDELYSLLEYNFAWRRTVALLESIFKDTIDKQKAWRDLLKLVTKPDAIDTNHAYKTVLYTAQLSYKPESIPDMQEAWNDIYTLLQSEDGYLNQIGMQLIDFVFNHLTRKDEAWSDLFNITKDKDGNINKELYRKISELLLNEKLDKQLAWDHLLNLSKERCDEEKSLITGMMLSLTCQVTQKEIVWNKLLDMASSQDHYKWDNIIESLKSLLPLMEDKQKAWNDLYNLALESKNIDRIKVIRVLITTYCVVPDKSYSWNKLYEISYDNNPLIREAIFDMLMLVIPMVPNRLKALEDVSKIAINHK